MPTVHTSFLTELWQSVLGDPGHLCHVQIQGSGDWSSVYAVTELACAAIGSASLALAEWMSLDGLGFPSVEVDRRLASLWFQRSWHPEDWTPAPVWDEIAGDYAAVDGWIRLHTNAPHHRQAALQVLGSASDKTAVARAVAKWPAEELENAIVAHAGCAAVMRTLPDWLVHPQGMAVAAEPLVHHAAKELTPESSPAISRTRPLQGIRVLDLTRVLAGPIATRFLAGYGADVLRIDPPDWNEPAIEPEVTVGKRCARLDLRVVEQRQQLEALLVDADVLVHGYRPGALSALGLDESRRRELNPRLIDVSLNAYGWSGPWVGRRGFDSLVQMSSGIAEAGMRLGGHTRPTPLPVQALDHAAGYLLAAAVLRGLTERHTRGRAGVFRTSLARIAKLLVDGSNTNWENLALAAVSDADFSDVVETSAWGPVRRLLPPAKVSGASMHWEIPARKLGWSTAEWRFRGNC